MSGTMINDLRLNDGRTIPALGFGVFQMPDETECRRAVRTALEAGFRHIDTALVYGNEQHVGAAIAESGVPRGEIFLTTKSPMREDPALIRPMFEESLEKLRTDYVDLYLIHWPMSDATLNECWAVLEELRAGGGCRSVGVSNFTVKRFENGFLDKARVTPAVDQVEMHVFNQQRGLVDYCAGKGIVIEAYSPLCRGRDASHPELERIAARHGRTVAQIMLRFLLESGVAPIVKSATPERIRENFAVMDFALDAADIESLRALDEGRVIQDWFPDGFY